MVYREDTPTRAGANIMMVPLDGRGTPSPVLATDIAEMNGEISPDGRFIAFDASDGGRTEVYVRPFPDVGAGRWQISSGGGYHPAWAAGGRELYFKSEDDHLFRVDVTPGATFQPGPPRLAIATPIDDPIGPRAYDVTPDGKRILLIEEVPSGQVQSPVVTVVSGWTEELKKRIPR